MAYGMQLQLNTIQAEQWVKQHKHEEVVEVDILQLKYGHILIEHLQRVHDSQQKNIINCSLLKIQHEQYGEVIDLTHKIERI